MTVRISVVVPVYNREGFIVSCLESLLQQTLPAYEILIVDNQSTDRSYAIIEEWITAHPGRFCRLLQEKTRGPSAARNCGVEAATGDIVAFTDSDCLTDVRWLEKLAAAYENETIGGTAGRILSDAPKNVIEKFSAVFTLRSPPAARTYDHYEFSEGGFPSANLSFRREVFVKAGGFEGEIYTEDYGLCAKVYRAGWKIRYTPEAIVYHCHRSSLRGMMRQAFGIGKGHPVLLKKYAAGTVILQGPGFRVRKKALPVTAMLDFSGMDKKVFFLGLLGFVQPVFFAVLAVYLVYLVVYLRKKVRQSGFDSGWGEAGEMVVLLLLKSISISAGRIRGAVACCVLCV